MRTMATEADELRESLRARLKDEALSDPRLKTLERWALRRPDDEVADAIELLMIGLDASRKGRWMVLRTIDEEFRQPDELLPHDERVRFLRWIVRSRETDANLQAKLRELHEARTPEARSHIVGALTADAASIEHAHPVFAHAWRAAPVDARPSGPVHHGEPEPVLGDRNTVRLVLSFARRVAHLVPRAEKKSFERLLELAASAVAAGRSNASLHDAFARASKEGAMGLARAACLEARAALSRPDMAGIAACPAAAKTVELLLAAEGKDAVRGFLSDLDEELRRLDLTHALAQRKKSPSRPIARAIHRAAEDGKVVLWLAELEGGQLGLLAKQGRLWTWTEGSRDEILATVPDAHFERAVMAETE
ncbi:MAG: hypothetical protein K0S65_3361 [Labilithrix sp.]|nr:hypothetical protein [Labilithrix sp.]